MTVSKKALVLFSGGQDSTTCLGWAKNRYESVTAISFFYGQRHDIELEQAKKVAASLEIDQKVMDVSFFGDLITSALTGEGDLNKQHIDNPSLPASFVPNRNIFFLVLAHSHAQMIKADEIVAGFCQTDFSGYPDCRDEFVVSCQKTLELGSEKTIPIITPLMHLTKAETFLLAERENILDKVLLDSHTCYEGSPSMNNWGRGCGNCPACKIREKGFLEYLELKKSC